MELLDWRQWPAYLRRSRLRILMYHSIAYRTGDRSAVAPELFAAEIKYLAERRFQVISLQEAVARFRIRGDFTRTIVLTFDDGSNDFLTTAVPILEQHHFTATVFIVTGLDTASWRSDRFSYKLLCLDEINEIKSRGFGIGSHTVSHPDLTTIGDAALENELVLSRTAIAGLGETFFSFAYPFGGSTRRERDAVARAGYDCGLIVGGRWGNGAETDRFLLKREPMRATDTLDWFKKRVDGYFELHFLAAQVRGAATR